MDTLWGIFFGSFVIGLSGAMMPGPMFVVVVGQTPRHGAWTGPVVVFGHGILESLLVGAVILGLAEFISSPAVITTVALIGGVVLLYMGVDMLRSAGSLSLFAVSGQMKGSMVDVHPFWAGILTSLANPYWTLWWATIGLGYMLIASKNGSVGLAVFLIGHIMSDLVWYTTVSTLVAGGKRWLTDSIYRSIIRACGVVLLFFALYFGWRAFHGISI